ncbi:hypothetical protein QT971_19145 [Microcoleus sp. herbarium19]|uniref:hypothetical protein n=1 Tax=unclassified Microcoleus TaxID=2642155 RepID=UPI002FD70A10
MPIRFPKKSEKFPELSLNSSSPSDSSADSDIPSFFAKLTAKLCWERENIEPELRELYPYYKHYCYIFLTPQCDEEYVGQGYGSYRDERPKQYDEIGQRLANLWPIDQETEERKVNHYSHGYK